MITSAAKRKGHNRNCLSIYWGIPRTAAGGHPSVHGQCCGKHATGKDPSSKIYLEAIVSKSTPLNPPLFSSSGLWPWGQGGVCSLGACCPVLPLLWNRMTLLWLMPALPTGHTCLLGLVSSHWCKHSQLHSKVLSWPSLSPAPLLLPWAPNTQVLRGRIGQGPLAQHPWPSASLEWSFSPEKSWISLSGQTSDPNPTQTLVNWHRVRVTQI